MGADLKPEPSPTAMCATEPPSAAPSELSGLAFLEAVRDGRHPPAAMAKTLHFRLTEVAPGRVVFRGTAGAHVYNLFGTVHGGWAGSLLDSCMGCAIHSTLPAGVGYTTLEYKATLVRAITVETGEVEAEGRIVRVGRRVGIAEGWLRDPAGDVLAHGTTTCLILVRREDGARPLELGP